jgi:hypothetical protein
MESTNRYDLIELRYGFFRRRGSLFLIGCARSGIDPESSRAVQAGGGDRSARLGGLISCTFDVG